MEKHLRSLAVLSCLCLLCSVSCAGRFDSTAEKPPVGLYSDEKASGEEMLKFEGWLFVPPAAATAAGNAIDASQNTGRVYIRIIVHSFSPDADFKILSQIIEGDDSASLHSTFGKTERAAVEYPRGGGMRERYPFALEMLGQGKRRILLFSEGNVNHVNRCWGPRVVDLRVDARGEGEGLLYSGRVFFTAEGNLDLDRPSTLSTPSRIGDVRMIK